MFQLAEILPAVTMANIGNFYDNKGRPLNLVGNATAKIRETGDWKTKTYKMLAPLDLAGLTKASVGGYVNDVAGINGLYVNERAEFNVTAFGVDYRASPGYDKDSWNNMGSVLQHAKSSEVGLFINLLRQYYLLSIERGTLKQEDVYYTDGHVETTYKQAFELEAYNAWGLTVGTRVPLDTSADCKIDIRSMTKEQGLAIAAALSELVGCRGIGMRFSTPMLCKKVHIASIDSHDGIAEAWSDFQNVKNTIVLLVTAGKMYNQFDVALNTISQIAVQFKAQNAESVKYLSGEYDFILPAFGTIRFEHPLMLTGSPALVRPTALANYKAWERTPNAFWVYSAIMRAAFEFRTLRTPGTDFDADNEIEETMAEYGLAGRYARWFTAAASTLGKKMRTLTNYELGAAEPLQFKDRHFKVLTSIGNYLVKYHNDEKTIVSIQMPNDYRRVGIHAKLLYALDLLYGGKHGRVITEGNFKIRASHNSKAFVDIVENGTNAFITASRIFGWDVTIKVGVNEYIRSWADNDTRLAWASNELESNANGISQVTDINWRGYGSKRQVFNPAVEGDYEFRLEITRVYLLHSYEQASILGDKIVKYELKDIKAYDVKQIIQIEYEIAGTRKVGRLSDFATLGDPAPGFNYPDTNRAAILDSDPVVVEDLET